VIWEIIFRFFWSGKLRGRRCEEVRIQMLKLGHLPPSGGKASSDGAK